MLAHRWVVVALVVLGLVALGQMSVSSAADPVAADASATLQVAATYAVGFRLVAACFAALGGIAFVLATDRVAARVFLGFATAAAAALLAAIAMPTGAPWAIQTEYLALIAVGASAPLLFLVFPVNRLGSPAGRRGLAICLTAHAAIVVLSWAVLALYPDSVFAVLPGVLWTVLGADLAGAIALAIGVLVVAPPRGGRERRLLGLVALGTVAGLAPFPLFVVAPTLASDSYLLAPWVALAGLVLLPTSLGAAILSGQFLGIERIVRRGLIALLVWMALIGVYGVVVDQFGDRVGAWSEEPPSGWLIIVIAGIAGTFPIVQSGLRRGFEHVLLRDVYDYRDTLQQLGFEIVHLRSVAHIAEHVLARLGRTLDLSWAAITVDGDRVYGWGACPDSAIALASQSAYRTPLVADGVQIGTLAVGPKRHDIDLLPEDLSLLGTLAHLLATALQNALLVKRLEVQVSTLADRQWALEALSDKLMRVQEDERRRLALDIHDEPLQRAILLARKLGEAAGQMTVRAWQRDAEAIVESLRAICSGLRPAELDHLGLAPGLRVLVDGLRAQTDVEATLTIEPATGWRMNERLPADLESALYRVTQEALNNCLKHADASRIEVTLKQTATSISLCVADDGRGFSPGPPGAPRGRLGILGMSERLRPWRGVVTLEPSPTGGTLLRAHVNLPVGGDTRVLTLAGASAQVTASSSRWTAR